MVALFAAIALFGSSVPATGQSASPTPRLPDEPEITATAQRRATFFAQFTPRPPRYEIRPGVFRIVEDIDLRILGLGVVALSPDGLLYVGDGVGSVRVFGKDFSDVGRFTAPQPFALSINSRGQLYIGQRNNLTLDLYDRQGKRLRNFWQPLVGTLETFAVAPDDTVYIVWQTRDSPRTAYMTRLDADGNLMFNKVLGNVEDTRDAVLALTFDAQGEMTMAVTGFGKAATNELGVLLYDPQGNPIRTRRPVLTDNPLRAPGCIVRTADGSLVLLTADYFAWFEPGGVVRAGTSPYVLREAGNPLGTLYQRSALVAQPDGRSVVLVDVRENGHLLLRNIGLFDRFDPTPAP